MKILLVSTFPFRKTSRGMDVMTLALDAAGHQVDHLTFPRVWYTPGKTETFPKNVRELLGRRVWLPYLDALMFWFPRWLFRIWVWLNRRSVKLDWNSYDLVVLESGKPMFLLDSLPPEKPLVYRQSDSVRHALGKGRWYLDLEDRVMDRARLILVVKQSYQDDLVPEHRQRSQIVRNGFTLPAGSEQRPPALEREKRHGIYFGLAPLDYDTMEYLLGNNPDTVFHVVGRGLSRGQLRKLGRHGNLRHHGFLAPQEYGPLIQHADFAFVPYAQVKAVGWMGFTSKYMVYMYFGLPIVSYPTGRPGEFDPYPQIRIVGDKQAFQAALDELGPEPEKVAYNFAFEHYSHEAVAREYQRVFRELEKEIS